MKEKHQWPISPWKKNRIVRDWKSFQEKKRSFLPEYKRGGEAINQSVPEKKTDC